VYYNCTVLGSDRRSELTGAKIDSFKWAISFRSEPNNFSLLSFRSPIWTRNYPL